MWALQIGGFGDPTHVATMVVVPKPSPGKGEVLLRLEGRPVNPNDLLFIRGMYTPAVEFPAAIGSEGVGVVEAVGDDVGMELGARVAFWYSKRGSFAECIVIPVVECFIVPHGLPTEQAAQVILNPLSALAILDEFGEMLPGDWVLHNGSNSAFGRFLIQYLKAKGFKSMSIVRSHEEASGLHELGTDAIICLGESGDLKAEVDKLTSGVGVKYAVDCVWGESADQMLRVLCKRGKLVAHGLLSGAQASLNVFSLLTGNRSIQGFVLPAWIQERSHSEVQERVDYVCRLLSDQVVTLSATAFKPSEFVEALRHGSLSVKPCKGIILG